MVQNIFSFVSVNGTNSTTVLHRVARDGGGGGGGGGGGTYTFYSV